MRTRQPAAVSEPPAVPARRADHGRRPRVPAPLALACLAGAVACAVAMAAGLWFAPFVVGVAIGALGGRRQLSRGLLASVLAAALGWAVPLLWAALHGAPIVATARVVAALAGLPPLPEIALLAAALTAALQGVVGCLLGRAVARWRLETPAGEPGAPADSSRRMGGGDPAQAIGSGDPAQPDGSGGPAPATGSAGAPTLTT